MRATPPNGPMRVEIDANFDGIMVALVAEHGSSGDPIHDFRDNQRLRDDEEGWDPPKGDRCPTDTGRDQCSDNQSVR